ncbi:MAG: acyl-CoA dehydrogenase family protein, partial [Panacagrimonas sp.]
MNAELPELRESARQVLGGLGLAAGEDKTWPMVLDLGWLLVGVPEESGGLGQGFAGACAFHEEIGRHLNGVAYLPAMLAVEAAARASAPTLRARWLERATSGVRITAPLAASHVSVSAAVRLSGSASAVLSADAAEHVLLWSDDSDLVVLLPLAQAGVERVHRPTWDTTRRLFDLRLTDVAIDSDQVLASGAEAQALSRRLAVQRDFALAADAIGGAGALLEKTVEYLQTRRQFGRPLALFQSLKHRCADLKTMVSAAEALLSDGLWRVGEQLSTPEAEMLGRGAKAYAVSVYARVAEEAVQLHGGIGMTAEHPCHLFLKRALLDEQLGRGGERYESAIAAAFLR